MHPNGRHVVVTGGLGGIGLPLVNRLKQAGADVTVIDRPGQHPPQGVQFLAADMASPDAVAELAAHLAAKPIDMLINLVGVNYFGPYATHPTADLRRLIQINLLTPLELTRAVLPGMLARQQGQIVNVGSVTGSLALPYGAAYSASKGGLKAFSEALRRETRGRGVSVTYIAPRAVKTPMNQGLVTQLNQQAGNREDTPGKVADHIMAAIQADKASVTIGQPERLLVVLNGLCPALFDRALMRFRRLADALLQADHNPHENLAK